MVAREFIYGKDSPEYKNASLFVETLSHYSHVNVKPEFRVFQILAAGKIDSITKKVTITKMGAHIPLMERYDFIKKIESEHVKCVEHILVNLNSDEEKKKCSETMGKIL